MHIEVVDNVGRSMEGVLAPAIEHSSDIRIAVAFVSEGGLRLIRNAIQIASQRGSSLEFLVGLDMRTTEPSALRFLYSLSRREPNISLYCNSSVAAEGIYHPKLYLFRTDGAAKVIIGSSNLTEGGLKRNVEVNAIITGDTTDEAISDSYTTYNRLKFHPNRVVPDDEFLTIYAELCNEEERQRRATARSERTRQLVRELRDKARTLPRPIPSRKDVVGWLELVYDALPDGEFTNKQAYASEQLFAHHFPGNKNIRAKVRQELQILRDMGMLVHLGRSRWRKL